MKYISIWPTLMPILITQVHGFWDIATTTETFERLDTNPRQSFFRWQYIQWENMRFWAPQWDWEELTHRRHLCVVAGISIDFLPLGVAAILNRRMLLTSANYLEPYLTRQKDVRIWALGRGGSHLTPYRYRVWRFRRVIPRSLNPEHWHGARGVHVPRHDISVIHSWDQIYVYNTYPTRYAYAYKTWLGEKRQTIHETGLTFAGSGFEYMEHVLQNYKIFYASAAREDVVNCETYLPKWWGKFICVKNTKHLAGVPNGGPLFTMAGTNVIIGIGCFEIRYNEDRIMVFTDTRYYFDYIYLLANMTPSEYYEYAYPQWSVRLGWVYDGNTQLPYIPHWQKRDDMYPLGR